MRAIHQLRYFAADAWDEWTHSPGVNLLAAATLTAALFLAGLFVLLLVNVRHEVDRQRRSIPVEVYLDAEIGDAERRRLESELAGEPGVARVEFVSKQLALERYRDWASEMAGLIAELDSNPLPAALEVFLEPSPHAEDVANRLIGQLTRTAGVEEVRFDRAWLQRLETLVEAARTGGAGLAVVIFGAVVLVMASVLRLAVFARREEIGIMLLVGATPAFVRGPFLVAGFVQGLVGSGIGLVLVEVVRRFALSRSGGARVLTELVAAQPLPLAHAAGVVLAGLVVSLAGSFFAVRLRALR